MQPRRQPTAPPAPAPVLASTWLQPPSCRTHTQTSTWQPLPPVYGAVPAACGASAATLAARLNVVNDGERQPMHLSPSPSYLLVDSSIAAARLRIPEQRCNRRLSFKWAPIKAICAARLHSRSSCRRQLCAGHGAGCHGAGGSRRGLLCAGCLRQPAAVGRPRSTARHSGSLQKTCLEADAWLIATSTCNPAGHAAQKQQEPAAG